MKDQTWEIFKDLGLREPFDTSAHIPLARTQSYGPKLIAREPGKYRLAVFPGRRKGTRALALLPNK